MLFTAEKINLQSQQKEIRANSDSCNSNSVLFALCFHIIFSNKISIISKIPVYNVEKWEILSHWKKLSSK